MLILLAELLIAGIIYAIIGQILFVLSINKYNQFENPQNQPIGIKLAFFSTGLILCLLYNFPNLNKN